MISGTSKGRVPLGIFGLYELPESINSACPPSVLLNDLGITP